MANEIERKFLVRDDSWRNAVRRSCRMVQGYLPASGFSLRLRIAGDQGFLTIKGPPSGISRSEFEYPVPVADAEAMLAQFGKGALVEKERFYVEYAGKCWEVDVFAGENAGLVTAEIELESEDEPFECPPWLGEDVSHVAAYRNGSLAKMPWRYWKNMDQ